MMQVQPRARRSRALFVDIDGTLVGVGDTVSPGVRQAINQARSKGVLVVLCTGRARHTTQPIAQQLGSPLGYAVTSNGGIALHLGTNQVLHRHLLPVPVALQIIRAIMAVGSNPMCMRRRQAATWKGRGFCIIPI